MTADRVECGACGKRMSAAAAACPHCGARADGTASEPAGGLAGVKLSVEEARALLVAEGRSASMQPVGPGLFGSLFLPHPMTSGGARVAELALTVTALPVLAASIFALAIMPRTYRRVRRETPGELKTPMLASAFGVPTLGWVLLMTGMSAGPAFGIAGLLASALFARAAVRGRAARARDVGDLFRAPNKRREKPPALPELPPARATRRPTSPPAAAPLRAPSPSPAAPPPDADEGPSFLK